MPADDPERGVTDHLVGHDGTDAERRHDVARVETGAAVRRETARLRPDPAAPRGRAPLAVLTAVALLTLLALSQAAILVILALDTAWWALVFLVVPAIPAVVAYGLWVGWRGSQIASVVIGFLLVLAGLESSDRLHLGAVLATVGVAVAALVVVPRSSRAWFC